MKRISIFIRDDQKNRLDKIAKSKKTSYSELIREAIDSKLVTEFGKISRDDILKKTFGILKDRFSSGVASEEVVDNLRSEWEQRFDRDKKQ
ncbi:MAG: ribbon-helix-helix protein, CopG family [Actinobacteria bacterium]|nr:ribbon-helix-helix protein, CopG family [Actinomycetota bacterium]